SQCSASHLHRSSSLQIPPRLRGTNMTEKVRIYIDVDGVINAFSNAQPWGKVKPSVTVAYGYRITYHQGLIDALKDIDNSNDNVEFVWLTTWQTLARTDLAPAVGLGGT